MTRDKENIEMANNLKQKEFEMGIAKNTSNQKLTHFEPEV